MQINLDYQILLIVEDLEYSYILLGHFDLYFYSLANQLNLKPIMYNNPFPVC